MKVNNTWAFLEKQNRTAGETYYDHIFFFSICGKNCGKFLWSGKFVCKGYFYIFASIAAAAASLGRRFLCTTLEESCVLLLSLKPLMFLGFDLRGLK